MKHPIKNIFQNNIPQNAEISNILEPSKMDVLDRAMNSNYLTYFRPNSFSARISAPTFAGYHSPVSEKGFRLTSAYSEDSALKDLVGIMNLILSVLGIPANRIRQHNLVLVLPNEFSRRDYEKFFECLIKKYMFQGISLQLESVMACFAAGLPLCLHCHIGYESSYINIVEEGIVRPDSIQEISLGVKDIVDLLVFYVFRKRGVDLSPYNSGLSLVLVIMKFASYALREDDAPTYTIELFNFHTQTWDKVQIFRADLSVVVNSIFIDNAFLGKHNRSLHRIILEKLSRLTNIELRKKLAVSIVLTGFLSSNPQIIDRFEEKLIRFIEVNNHPLEEVMVVDALNVRNLIPFSLMWNGGAILPKLDSFNGLLINSHKYLGGVCVWGN